MQASGAHVPISDLFGLIVFPFTKFLHRAHKVGAVDAQAAQPVRVGDDEPTEISVDGDEKQNDAQSP